MTIRSKSLASKAQPKYPLRYLNDEATQYALSVVEGTEMAGPHVRAACQRHLDDLSRAHERGLVWDAAAVARVLRFFRVVLCLNGGEFEGKPFNPLPWQCFILGSIFGWKKLTEGRPRYKSTTLSKEEFAEEEKHGLYRRFRVAYQETGKGSGKSPLAAGVGLYMQLADNEPRAEVYAAATKKDQAMILFRDAVAMVDLSTHLKGRVKKSGKAPNVWNIAHAKTDSFFRPIASEDGQSGPRPHCALLDEIHEHKGGHVVEMMRAGTKGRRQALIFMITNSGTDRTSICFDYHEYGAKVSAQQVQDDSFFAYICAHDQGEDPFQDESCWKKSNPSLGHTFGYEYLREQVREARGMPSKESTVRRLNFCQWVQAHNPWLSDHIWRQNGAAPVPLDKLRGEKCIGGLDLSSKNDLSALLLLFEHDDGTISVHPWFWIPEDMVVEKVKTDRVPYDAWIRNGYLTAVPGKTIDYAFIAAKLAELSTSYEIEKIRFDRWRIDDLKRALAEVASEDIPLEEHGQGFKDMNPAIEAAEDLLKNSRLRHGNHPVLTWCVANAVTVKDPAELRKFDKSKATGRIDGAVALAMASRGLVANDNDDGPLDEFISNPIILG